MLIWQRSLFKSQHREKGASVKHMNEAKKYKSLVRKILRSLGMDCSDTVGEATIGSLGCWVVVTSLSSVSSTMLEGPSSASRALPCGTPSGISCTISSTSESGANTKVSICSDHQRKKMKRWSMVDTRLTIFLDFFNCYKNSKISTQSEFLHTGGDISKVYLLFFFGRAISFAHNRSLLCLTSPCAGASLLLKE